MRRIIAIAIAAPLWLAAPWGASAATILGLTADNKIVTFDSEKRAVTKTVAISGIEGGLIGFDIRPIDGKLYGVNEGGTIYTIDVATGKATPVSKLDKKFEHAGKALVDFNPQADRLRLIGVNGTSFRVDVDKGTVTVDGSLKYADNDANKGKKPAVSMGAYTNTMPKARGTELFNVDTDLGVLVLQSPPNDGVLQTRGSTGVKFSRNASIDILLDGNDDNIAYAVDGKTLYTVDLKTGVAKKSGDVAGLDNLIDIAVVPIKR